METHNNDISSRLTSSDTKDSSDQDATSASTPHAVNMPITGAPDVVDGDLVPDLIWEEIVDIVISQSQQPNLAPQPEVHAVGQGSVQSTQFLPGDGKDGGVEDCLSPEQDWVFVEKYTPDSSECGSEDALLS